MIGLKAEGEIARAIWLAIAGQKAQSSRRGRLIAEGIGK